ncbi:hypothetical protein SAMN02910358_01025 [Lachnospiraceae bacterium XBB1006]|nr:hypothetical protein SAMN02910358_01025 [Lachnospiraceae bacterium XBB1006]
MLLVFGVGDERKDLDFNQIITCEDCGAYGSFRVFMTYTACTVFFIPVVKWNKRYYVQTRCCKTLYELRPEIGKRIAGGEKVEILPHHMRKIHVQSAGAQYHYKKCRVCGFDTSEDFSFCPKCGTRFAKETVDKEELHKRGV